jgi:hypothetical protein
LGDGTLNGKYANNACSKLEPENAVPVGSAQGFIGTYNTTWEQDGVKHHAVLVINQGKNTDHFTLEWTQGKKIAYEGNGFLENGRMEGHYRKV